MTLDRENKLLIGLGAMALILIAKLFSIQIIDDKYKQSAENNTKVYTTIYPTRGIIHDRNGKILVGNKVTYDLMVTPKEVGEFDTLALAKVLDVTPEFIHEKMQEFRKNRKRIGFQSVVMMKKLPPEVYMKFAEISYQFPGFRGQARNLREYPYNAGGNLLGYVSEVNENYLKKHGDEYKAGDYAGMTGIEAAREKELRGIKGYNIWLRNSKNKIESRFMDGAEDKEAIPGNDITTTIDAELQNYGQELMKNKVGSLIAIEPSTGEILAMISSPGIDVDKLADFGQHYNEISKDPYKPMFNRTVQAPYPPGSVFKLVNGLIGLQEGVFKPSTVYPCSMGYHFGNRKLGCHAHKSPINFEESIMMSCNAYYCYVLRDILENEKYGSIDEALNKWREYVMSFGFGQKLGSDIPSELPGFIPDAAYYNKYYRKGGWKATTVISLSIGQGEIGCTPLHLANLCATLANRGHYYTPHIIKDSENVTIDPKYKEKHYTLVDTTHFTKVIGGMYRAVNSGFGSGGTASIAAVPGLEICGKTGTAQNPHGDDHSVFICFAPKDNPKIAVAAFVENGGFGASYAAPIASLLTEKYLNGDISGDDRKALEKRMKDANLLHKVKVKK
jgi:penicillin-binding protein 2